MGLDAGAVRDVARSLSTAQRVLCVTGAGLSAESGLPTYRGIGGLYETKGTDDGVPIEVALSGQTMRSDPALSWKYIHQIEAACRGAVPNRGHQALALLEQRLPHLCVLTQNVDGLHRAAGTRNLIEIHGNVHDLICVACGEHRHVADYAGLEIPPACEACGGLVRPEVVLFGEMLPGDAVARLQAETNAGFDAVLSIGTTSVFPYIAEPMLVAAQSGRLAVEINPGWTVVSDLASHRLRVGAAEALNAIWDAM